MEDQQNEFFIELENDKDSIESLKSLPEDIYELFKAKRADASTVVLQVLTYLTPITLPIIAGIIIARIKSRKYVKVKIKGIELRGLSEASVERILKEHLDGEKKEN